MNPPQVRRWFMREQHGWRAVVTWLSMLVGFGVVWGGVYYALIVRVSGLAAGVWFVAMAWVFAMLFLANGCGMARWADAQSPRRNWLDNTDAEGYGHAMSIALAERPTQVTDTGWVAFDGLPVEAQQAVQHWTTVHSPEYLTLCARLCEWRMLLIETETVIERVMATGDHVDDFDGDWEAYHDWYLSRGRVPDHGTSRWPVIEASVEARNADEGYLDDGWHRFHSYVAAGDTHIPVLRSRRLPD